VSDRPKIDILLWAAVIFHLRWVVESERTWHRDDGRSAMSQQDSPNMVTLVDENRARIGRVRFRTALRSLPPEPGFGRRRCSSLQTRDRDSEIDRLVKSVPAVATRVPGLEGFDLTRPWVAWRMEYARARHRTTK
jgi:hypothetical protein